MPHRCDQTIQLAGKAAKGASVAKFRTSASLGNMAGKVREKTRAEPKSQLQSIPT